MSPDVHFSRIYPEVGQLSAVMADDTVTPPRFAYLAGMQIQGTYRLYAQKVDSLGSPEWTRTYGSSDHISRLTRTEDSALVFLGYTTANPSVDYRFMRLSEGGFLLGSYPFGGNTTDDVGYGMIQRPNGRMIVTGQTQSHPDSARHMSLLQVSTQGIVDWGRTLPDASAGMGTILDGDSGIFIYGTADSISETRSDFIRVRTDSLGLNPVYHRYAGDREEICTDVIRISADLTVMAGYVRDAESDSWDVFALAINDAGDSLWSQSCGTHADDIVTAIIATTDNDSGLVMAGWSEGGPSGERRGMLIKLNRQGDSLWTFFAPDDFESEFADVIQDSAWRYHAAGHIHTDLNHGYYLVTEPDPHSPGIHPPQQFSLLDPEDHAVIDSGTVRFGWDHSADPDSADTVRYMLELDYDTLFMAARTFGPLDTNLFVWAADTDEVDLFWRVTAEDQQDHARLCRERYREFRMSIPDSTQEFGLLFPDSGAMLPRPLSEFRWSRAADPDVNDTVIYTIHFMVGDTGMTFPGLPDTFINVSFVNNPMIHAEDTVTWFVTAESHRPPMTRESLQRWTFHGWDLAAEETAPLALEFGLDAPFPNPFNAVTTLRYTVERAGSVRLDIFSVEGRLTETLVSGMHTPGRYDVQWNADQAASGVYFARLSGGNQMRTAKLLLLK